MRKIEMIYSEQDPPRFYAMIKAILSSLHGKEFDGIQAMRYFIETYGIDEDWHVYSAVLDWLYNSGQADIIKPGGYVVYRIK